DVQGSGEEFRRAAEQGAAPAGAGDGGRAGHLPGVLRGQAAAKAPRRDQGGGGEEEGRRGEEEGRGGRGQEAGRGAEGQGAGKGRGEGRRQARGQARWRDPAEAGAGAAQEGRGQGEGQGPDAAGAARSGAADQGEGRGPDRRRRRRGFPARRLRAPGLRTDRRSGVADRSAVLPHDARLAEPRLRSRGALFAPGRRSQAATRRHRPGQDREPGRRGAAPARQVQPADRARRRDPVPAGARVRRGGLADAARAEAGLPGRGRQLTETNHDRPTTTTMNLNRQSLMLGAVAVVLAIPTRLPLHSERELFVDAAGVPHISAGFTADSVAALGFFSPKPAAAVPNGAPNATPDPKKPAVDYDKVQI